MTIHTHNGGEQHDHPGAGAWHHHDDVTSAGQIITHADATYRRNDFLVLEQVASFDQARPLAPSAPTFTYVRDGMEHTTDAQVETWDDYNPGPHGGSMTPRVPQMVDDGEDVWNAYVAGSAWDGADRRRQDGSGRRITDRGLLGRVAMLERDLAAYQARGRTEIISEQDASEQRVGTQDALADRDAFRVDL